MKVDKRANFCIFLVIAILALGLSNFAAAFTGDFVSASFPGINETDKMIALDDDNFAPASLNPVYEKKVVEEVNETENETDSNSTEVEEDDNSDNSDDDQNTDNSDDQNNNNDQNDESDSNNNQNDGGEDSEPKPAPNPSEDTGDDE